MKTKRPFNLEEFKKNPNIEVENGYGKRVKIIYTELRNRYPVVGIAERFGEDVIFTYTAKGKYISDKTSAGNDLYFVEYTE